MTEEKEGLKVAKREVGERVDVMFNVDTSTVKDLGDGTFSATITTSEVDRMGETIDTQGISTDAYMKNPVVLYGHDYSGLPIGKSTALKSFKNKMTATFQLAVEEYPFAATVAAMIKGGYLNAVSIGGVVKEWSDDYRQIMQMEMVEFSVVPVPANPSALISSRTLKEVTGKTNEEIAVEYHEFFEKQVASRVKSVDKNELKRHIESLESLVAILKDASTVAEVGKETERKQELITVVRAAGRVSQTGQQIIKFVKKEQSS